MLACGCAPRAACGVPLDRARPAGTVTPGDTAYGALQRGPGLLRWTVERRGGWRSQTDEQTSRSAPPGLLDPGALAKTIDCQYVMSESKVGIDL